MTDIPRITTEGFVSLNTATNWAEITPQYNIFDMQSIQSLWDGAGDFNSYYVREPMDDAEVEYRFDVVARKVDAKTTLAIMSDILGVDLFEPAMLREFLHKLGRAGIHLRSKDRW